MSVDAPPSFPEPHAYRAVREYVPDPLALQRRYVFPVDVAHPAPCEVCGLSYGSAAHYRPPVVR